MCCFTLVEMNEDAAITELDGAEWMDRQLRVNQAKLREENTRHTISAGGMKIAYQVHYRVESSSFKKYKQLKKLGSQKS